MGHDSTVDLKRAARWFHALAEETRLRIIEKLRAGEECVCNLTDTLETGQSRLSFHLKTLKDAGLVKDRRQGRWIYYSLNPEAIQDLERFVQRLEAGRSTLQLVCRER
jgi:ArsR family transcriptional regulator, arsenate/arsenite/antimonite-responsive transcriptional repressor